LILVFSTGYWQELEGGQLRVVANKKVCLAHLSHHLLTKTLGTTVIFDDILKIQFV
jgi:hypothetical protein